MRMTRTLALIAVLLIAAVPDLAAQNLVITNARILDGTGRVIERGTHRELVEQGGRYAALAGFPAYAEAA